MSYENQSEGTVNVSCGRSECFGWIYGDRGLGVCRVLIDTNFGNRECPFFKTREQYLSGIIHSPRKKRRERTDNAKNELKNANVRDNVAPSGKE